MFYPNLVEAIIDRVCSNDGRFNTLDALEVPASVFTAACSFVRACLVAEHYGVHGSNKDADLALANLDCFVAYVDERRQEQVAGGLSSRSPYQEYPTG